LKTHDEALAQYHFLTFFLPILTFDSMLERRSLFSARQKAGFLDFRILKILINRHLAFEQNFKKSAFTRHGESNPISEMLSNVQIGWKTESGNGTF